LSKGWTLKGAIGKEQWPKGWTVKRTIGAEAGP
jgi:hypothetical protein